jgi:acetyl-CoA decarbonylase/synthase complex subunit gamma
MALTGIQIFKLLPKTNCGDCGVPTCLAFAMNLAAGKAELDSCPHVSEEAKEQLSEASAPPIRPVKMGAGDGVVTAGGETVLFRHEKTFYNPTLLAALLADNDGEADAKLERWMSYRWERVGLILKPDMVAVKANGDAGKFAAMVKKVIDKTDFVPILISEDKDILAAGADACGDRVPLLYGATEANLDDMIALAQDKKAPLGIKAGSVEALEPLTEKAAGAGIKDLVIDSGSRELKAAFEDSIAIRRAALMDLNRNLGYPTIAFPTEMTDDLDVETMTAAMLVAKYGGIVVLSDFTAESVFPLLLERLNIFTDPQRPMTVTQGIYEINNPGPDSPVCVTSNFSLTYFIVAGEIEASRVPTWLMIMDTEGLSVLTAWAAGKFAGDAVGIFIKKSGITDKVKHQAIVIPGYAAAISGDLEEELPGWNVQIGPREAAHLPKFLKEWAPDK